ncbi:hypothetical protein LIER_15403 [Lithospermum erythrorhizon]|uniref:Uncharacterized protein n=1 Tax=Lithospermum erythrorhizon TaxID=34254 RepID=A0AAV3Q481_LITER
MIFGRNKAPSPTHEANLDDDVSIIQEEQVSKSSQLSSQNSNAITSSSKSNTSATLGPLYEEDELISDVGSKGAVGQSHGFVNIATEHVRVHIQEFISIFLVPNQGRKLRYGDVK